MNVYNDDKNSIVWRELDGDLYNNHFLDGQCAIYVEFNHSGIAPYRLNIPIYPDDITFGSSTNFTSAEIIGRPGTISGYVSTGDVSSRIALHLHRELQTFNEVAKDVNQIDDLVSLIQACQYPKRTQSGIFVPIVTYKFGNVKITGKQLNYNTKWSGPKIGNMYMDCHLDIQISHITSKIKYFDDMYDKKPYYFN